MTKSLDHLDHIAIQVKDIQKALKWYLDNSQWWRRVLSGAYRLERIGKLK